MKITKQEEETIINFGAFDYDAEKMANILDQNKDEIIAQLKDKQSTFSKLFQKGKDMADYVIDLKLLELAKTGDIKAIDKFEARKTFRKD